MPFVLLLFAGYGLFASLTPVLPAVLSGLAVEPERLLDVAGLMLFLSSAAFAVGTLLAPVLAARLGELRAIAACHAAACLLGAGLGLVSHAWSFTAVRCLQTLLLGPVIALVTSRTAVRVSPQALGALNSARMVANFAGPVTAGMLFAHVSSGTLFALLAAMAAASLLSLHPKPMAIRNAREGPPGP